MKLLDGLSAKWSSKDPLERVRAVKGLSKSDDDQLNSIARLDTDARVRLAAVRKIRMPSVLLKIAENDPDAKVREVSFDRARILLVKIASDSIDEAESMRAISLLSVGADIAKVATQAKFPIVRETAVRNLPDDDAKAVFIGNSENDALCLHLISTISSDDAFRQIIRENSDRSSIANAVLAKTDKPSSVNLLEEIANDQTLPKSLIDRSLKQLRALSSDCETVITADRNESLRSLCEELKLVSSADDLDNMNRILSSWNQITADFQIDAKLLTRFSRARDRARRLTSSKENVPNSEGSPPAGQDASSSTNTELARKYLPGLTRIQEELVAGNPETAAKQFSKMSRLWPSIEKHVDNETITLFDKLERLLREQQVANRLQASQGEEKNLATVLGFVDSLQTLASSDATTVKSAHRALNESEQLLNTLGSLPQSVNRTKIYQDVQKARGQLVVKMRQVQEINDWERWKNAEIQAALIKRAQSLVESQDIQKVATELKKIHADWRTASKAPPDKARRLWEQYQEIRKTLLLRCRTYFNQRKALHKENLELKVKICENAEKLIESRNWNTAINKIDALRDEWKLIGPVSRDNSDIIWKRFQAATRNLYTKRREYFQERKKNIAESKTAKKAILASSMALRESTEWKMTALKFKQLQTDWRKAGSIPKKDEEKLWQDFREHCDYFFERHGRRHEIENESQRKQRTSILRQLCELCDAESPSADKVVRLKEIWLSWQNLGTLPSSELELQQKIDSVISRITADDSQEFSDTIFASKTNLKKRENLVKRLKTVIEPCLSQANNSTDSSTPELKDVAAMLKEALAQNTMVGTRERERGPDWRKTNSEVNKICKSWVITTPIAGEQGQELAKSFYQAHLEYKKAFSEATRQ